MSSGDSTANLTGWVNCNYSAGHSIEQRYVNGKVVEDKWYFSNGKPRRHGHFWLTPNGNSRRDKTWIEWWDNGKKRSETIYQRGDRHGAFVSFAEAGWLREKGLHHKDRKVAARIFNEDGSVRLIVCMEDSILETSKDYGPMCGFKGRSKITTYYKKGTKKLISTFLRGDRVAYEKYNMAGNMVKSQQDATVTKVGIQTTRHANGKRKQETRYNKSGKYHGLQREFDKSGPLTREAQFDKGIMIEELLYYLNGQLKRKTARQAEGTQFRVHATTFYDNGNVESRGQYIERKEYHYFGYGSSWSYKSLYSYGQHCRFRRDGTLSSISRYKDDKREGLSVDYHHNGKTKEEEREYVEDRMVRRKRYDLKGRLTSHEEFFADGSSKRHKVSR